MTPSFVDEAYLLSFPWTYNKIQYYLRLFLSKILIYLYIRLCFTCILKQQHKKFNVKAITIKFILCLFLEHYLGGTINTYCLRGSLRSEFDEVRTSVVIKRIHSRPLITALISGGLSRVRLQENDKKTPRRKILFSFRKLVQLIAFKKNWRVFCNSLITVHTFLFL